MIDADEIRTIRETARAFLSSTEESRTFRDAAELGWLAMSVPERCGGLELGLQFEIPVFEESGAALYAEPLFATTGLALPVLVAAGNESIVRQVVEGEVRATLAWAEDHETGALADAERAALRVEGGGKEVRLFGAKRWVIDADKVDGFVVVARTDDGPSLFWVEAVDARIAHVDGVDATRRLADVVFEASDAQLLLRPSEARSVLKHVRRRSLVLACAEANGIAARMVEESVAYASVRQQFGRTIGTYQAISHRITDMYVALEISRALVQDAGVAVDERRFDHETAVLAAAATAIPAAIKSCESAIQIHGGVGMTWESDLHRYYKRALTLGAIDRPAWRQREAYAEGVFATAARDR